MQFVQWSNNIFITETLPEQRVHLSEELNMCMKSRFIDTILVHLNTKMFCLGCDLFVYYEKPLCVLEVQFR
jgi:hypothetical protein